MLMRYERIVFVRPVEYGSADRLYEIASTIPNNLFRSFRLDLLQLFLWNRAYTEWRTYHEPNR